MRYTQNINLPIVEDNDLYSKEINNLAFEKIDEEIQGLADIVETLDSSENSIADIKKDINDINEHLDSVDNEVVRLKDFLENSNSGNVSQEDIKTAVNDYFEENPVQSGATVEQSAQIEANKTAIGDENSGLIKEVNDIKNTELQNLNTAILRVNETLGDKSGLPSGDANVIASINRIDSKTSTGTGLTSEQISQLQTAYEHSQSPHVTTDDVSMAVRSYVNSNIGLLKGDKGDKGEQGERGLQGERGPQGEQGMQGPKGDTPDMTAFEEKINVQYEQINTKVISVEERVQAIEENGVGGENASVKKLIVKYVHDVGEIINITDLDISTGIFTTDTDISAYSGNVTPVKKDGVNYLTSSHIPKELQNLSNTRISIVSSNTFKCGSISVYSKKGDFSKYGIMANGVSSIKLENAFQPNRRYEIEIDTSTTDYVTGIPLTNSVSGFKPELGQTIGGEQYSSYLNCLILSNVQGINGISHRIKLNNYTTCFELLCTSFSSGLKADTEVNKQVSFIYKYNGKPMEHFSYSNFRNLIPKGTTIKIYDLGEIESEG